MESASAVVLDEVLLDIALAYKSPAGAGALDIESLALTSA
jgi:hypothetical protein